MTREETIKWLESLKAEIGKSEHRTLWHYAEAIDMAIESLQREEAEEKGYCHRIRPKNVEVVVRCKDCRYYSKGENYSDSWALCTFHTGQYISVDDNEFCSYGERREP